MSSACRKYGWMFTFGNNLFFIHLPYTLLVETLLTFKRKTFSAHLVYQKTLIPNNFPKYIQFFAKLLVRRSPHWTHINPAKHHGYFNFRNGSVRRRKPVGKWGFMIMANKLQKIILQNSTLLSLPSRLFINFTRAVSSKGKKETLFYIPFHSTSVSSISTLFHSILFFSILFFFNLPCFVRCHFIFIDFIAFWFHLA